MYRTISVHTIESSFFRTFLFSSERCMQSLEPCIDPMFRHCIRCNRVALSVSPQVLYQCKIIHLSYCYFYSPNHLSLDRLSAWRSMILHPMCIYCDLPLTWKEF
ncbi:uncharacterized protein DC041_0006145 [Schistosoma bovis]|uniref:Uncharacterized protein n=1 Tax=Schistosoma bovis TaxID=6184 RepID=A0A430QII5_SCHBO|nr:uncharacterized protein DC041_0006145 [Schistosoma bovis]